MLGENDFMHVANQINFNYKNNTLTNKSNIINLSDYSNNQGIYTNGVNFKGKTKNILLKLLRFNIDKEHVTKGHIQTIYHDSNLNDMLRNPQTALFDVLAMNNAPSIGNNFTLRRILNKDVVLESPEKMKTRLNSEFKLLKPTNNAMKMYRGVSQLSDEIYSQFKSFKKGDTVIPDKGFAYLTKDQNIALEYAKCSGTQNSVVLNIKIPRHSKISKLKAIVPPSKKEFLPRFKDEAVVPAESQYEVIKDSYIDKDGVLQVFLKYLNKW